MDYFGKDIVNIMLLVYIALGGSAGIKALLTSFSGSTFDSLDKDLVIDIKIKLIGLDLEATIFDLICCVISCIVMAGYYFSQSWVLNNVISLIFCVHTL